MTTTPAPTPRNQLYAAATRLRQMRFPAAMTDGGHDKLPIGGHLRPH
ncbi:hypothetical protein ABIE67_007863 [Streptomyces sp. V4I8]